MRAYTAVAVLPVSLSRFEVILVSRRARLRLRARDRSA